MDDIEEPIAVFMPTLKTGGAERVAVNLIKEWAEQKIRVDLMLAQAHGALLSEIPKSVNVVDLDSTMVPGAGLFSSIPDIVTYLRSERPPVLLSLMNHANVTCLFAHRISGVSTKIVISEHSPPQSLTSTKNKVLLRLARAVYPWADSIVASSKYVASDLSRGVGIDLDRIQMIYNPITTPELLTQAEEQVDHPWFCNSGAPVILSVGRLHQLKNFSCLIRAFRTVRNQREAKLVIIGEGSHRPVLEDTISEMNLSNDIQLLGYRENPYKYMRRASVFVLPSLWEGFGNVLVEAMACGCPIVSTACPGGPVEILDGGRYGELVPLDDHETMAERICSQLDSPTPTSILRDRSNYFSSKRLANEYLELIAR